MILGVQQLRRVEWEPFPSSRAQEFIARTRMTLDEAFARVPAALSRTPPA